MIKKLINKLFNKSTPAQETLGQMLNPEFYYGDIVYITGGFYKGRVAVVLTKHENTTPSGGIEIEYGINLESGFSYALVKAEDLILKERL